MISGHVMLFVTVRTPVLYVLTILPFHSPILSGSFRVIDNIEEQLGEL